MDKLFCCAFILGKTRLAPIKPLTIPRLELQAAVMAVRMSAMIQKELDVLSSQITYWTDSTTVLQYIKSETTRFHSFVSNRVAEINDVLDPKSWIHVPGRLNAADCSRGLSAQEILGESRWIHGPKFLWKEQNYWPDQPACQPSGEDDPEVKWGSWLVLTSEISDAFMDPKRTSSWTHLVRVTTWVLRFVFKCRDKDKRTGLQGELLSVDEISTAEDFWINRVQAQAYPDDLARLLAGKQLHLSSDPCIHLLMRMVS